MFKNETKTRMMAFAVVAMFMLTAFSVVLVEDSDAADGDSFTTPYNVYMTENDSFSYTATANLTGTTFSAEQSTSSFVAGNGTALTTSANATSGLKFSTDTLSADSIKAGTFYVIIKAHWSADSLSQDAYQYIVFHVSHDLAISQTKSTYSIDASEIASAAKTIDTVTVVNQMDNMSSTSAVTWAVSNNGEGSSDADKFTINNGVLSIKAGTAAGTYAIKVTASQVGHGVADQSKFVGYTITVISGATAIEGQTITTFVGDVDNNAVTSHFNGAFTSSAVWTASDSGAKASFNKSSDAIGTDYTVSDDLTVTLLNSSSNISTFGINATSTNTKVTGTITYSVTGKTTGATDSTATRTIDYVVTYNLYPALVFTSTPSLTSTAYHGSVNNALDVLMTANATGANKVIFNWGDGTVNDEVVINGSQSLVSQNHHYGVKGMYTVTMTAVNDFGSDSSVVLYNAGDDSALTPAATHEITIKDGSDASKLVGKVTVEEGKAFAIKDIVIDADYDMSKKKIVNLYTEAAGADGKFDETKLWNSSTKVTSASPTQLYAEIEDKTATENFFDEHGWIFIAFIVLAILALVAYFGFGIQHPAVLVAAGVFVIFAILCFVHKDFAGIWDALTGIFEK